MLQLGSFSAWISVDNVELEQYGLEISADGKQASCWIPSEAGKEFCVEWSDSGGLTPTCGYVKVDGVECGGRFLRDLRRTTSTSHDHVPTSSTTCRPFCFSAVEVTDDDSYLDTLASQNLGEINLSIWRGTIGPPSNFVRDAIPEDQKIHERSKKALVHCVKFGEEQQVTRPFYGSTRLDQAPVATFTFKYRSVDILRANGIMPLPTPTSEKRKATGSLQPDVPVKDEGPEEDDDDPDLAEARVLEAQLKAIREKISKKGYPAKKIKLESASSIVVPRPGEVIDLT